MATFPLAPVNEVSAAGARPRRPRVGRTRTWIVLQRLSRLLATVFFDLKVYGAHNIPRTGGAVLVSNHQSYLDSVLLSIHCDRALSYLARAETFNNPGFGWLVRALNAFPISQGAGDIRAIRESIDRVKDGHLLMIFPEGSRSGDGQIKPLEKGAGLIIRRARAVVVPAVIVGSFEAWPKGARFPRPAPIRILYGAPMEGLWKLEGDQIMAEIDATLRAMHDNLRAGRIPPVPRRPAGR